MAACVLFIPLLTVSHLKHDMKKNNFPSIPIVDYADIVYQNATDTSSQAS